MTLDDFKAEILPLKSRLYRYILSIVMREELAKDITQEVFMKVWEKRTQMDGIKNKEAWCIRCARNLSLDKLKAHNNKVKDLAQVYGASDPGEQPHREVETKDLLKQVEQLMAVLPQKQREIFRLRELAGYSNQEIGDLLNLDPGQVKVNLFRARQRVRTSLKKRINYGLQEN